MKVSNDMEFDTDFIKTFPEVLGNANIARRPVNKHKKKGSELYAQKRELGLAREELARLKSEKCPYSTANVMGGAAFQWRLEHEDRIKSCEARIANIKAEMEKITQKQR